jgi:hypothetical protein
MAGGAATAPTAEPLLKMPTARERCSAANHSATTSTAAGQLPASPAPSRKRHMPNPNTPRTKKCKISATDHHSTEMR